MPDKEKSQQEDSAPASKSPEKNFLTLVRESAQDGKYASEEIQNIIASYEAERNELLANPETKDQLKDLLGQTLRKSLENFKIKNQADLDRLNRIATFAKKVDASLVLDTSNFKVESSTYSVTLTKEGKLEKASHFLGIESIHFDTSDVSLASEQKASVLELSILQKGAPKLDADSQVKMSQFVSKIEDDVKHYASMESAEQNDLTSRIKDAFGALLLGKFDGAVTDESLRARIKADPKNTNDFNIDIDIKNQEDAVATLKVLNTLLNKASKVAIPALKNGVSQVNPVPAPAKIESKPIADDKVTQEWVATAQPKDGEDTSKKDASEKAITYKESNLPPEAKLWLNKKEIKNYTKEITEVATELKKDTEDKDILEILTTVTKDPSNENVVKLQNAIREYEETDGFVDRDGLFGIRTLNALRSLSGLEEVTKKVAPKKAPAQKTVGGKSVENKSKSKGKDIKTPEAEKKSDNSATETLVNNAEREKATLAELKNKITFFDATVDGKVPHMEFKKSGNGYAINIWLDTKAMGVEYSLSATKLVSLPAFNSVDELMSMDTTKIGNVELRPQTLMDKYTYYWPSHKYAVRIEQGKILLDKIS